MSQTTARSVQTVSVLTLTGMVVGSIVGGGVFSLPADFGGATGALGAVIAWVVAGLGMLMLAFVFQSLAVRRPDLDNGIYVYAQAGFGNYAGFNAAWGYWAGNVVGNVFYLTFVMASIGAFVPGLGQGTTVLAVLAASVVVWVLHLLITRGVRDTMLVTTFVFLGVEGASVYSRMARRREDVGRATLLGFLSTLALFASVTLVSYGVLPQHDLAEAKQPSMGVVLESVVGEWGATLIDLGVIVSVMGAYLAWTLLNAEVLHAPARSGVLPRALGSESRNGTPVAALVVTNISVQLFLLLVLVINDALEFMLNLDTALTLVPYLLVAAYACKLTITGQTYEGVGPRKRRRDRLVAVLALAYAVFLLYAAGVEYLLLGCLIYAPGTLLYLWSRRERGEPAFTRPELVSCVLLWVVAGLGAVLLATGFLHV